LIPYPNKRLFINEPEKSTFRKALKRAVLTIDTTFRTVWVGFDSCKISAYFDIISPEPLVYISLGGRCAKVR